MDYIRIAIASVMVLASTAVFAQGFTTLDTTYTPSGYQDGMLGCTLYLPSTPNGVGIVAVHEILVTRTSMTIWCDTLAAHGFTVMSIDYPDPVGQAAKFPLPIRAFKTAVQFMRKHKLLLKLTSDHVLAIGRSMGAAVIAQSIIDEEDYAAFGLDNAVDDHVDLAVLLYGLYDYTNYTTTNLPLDIRTFTSSYFLGNSSTELKETPVLASSRIRTPLLLLHGTGDATLEYQQSVEFHDSLTNNGKPSDLIFFENQPHLFETTFDNSSFTTEGLTAKDSVLAYLRSQKESVSTPPQPAGPEILIEPNYPNPFGVGALARTTTIEFSLAHGGTCNIALFNSLGQQVRTLRSGFFSQGEHNFSIDAAGLGSGVYYCKIVEGTSASSRPILVLN